MVSIVVILSSIVGIFILESVSQMTQTGPVAGFDSDHEGSNVVITHTGGQTINSDDLYIITDEEKKWSDLSETSTVNPGNSVEISKSNIQGESDIWIVYRSSDGEYSEVLFRETVFGDGNGFDILGGKEVVDEVEENGVNEGMCEESEQRCEISNVDIDDSTIEGFTYLESRGASDADGNVDKSTIRGSYVINAGGGSDVSIIDSTIEGDLYIKSHAIGGSDGDVSLNIDNSEIGGDIVIDSQGDLDLDVSGSVNGNIDENGDIDISEP